MSEFSSAAPFQQKQTILCGSKLAKPSQNLFPGLRARSKWKVWGRTHLQLQKHLIHAEMWEEYTKSLRTTSAKEKKKEQFSREED